MNLLKEVAEKVNRPFEIKLAETMEIINHHFWEFPDNNVAVAFSGGKDSEVVLWLCLQVNPNVPVVFNNTGVEYPETIKLVSTIAESWNLNIIITHPEKTFWQCVEQYGFPQQTKRGGLKYKNNRPYCCYYLKEKPMLKAIRANGWLGYFTGETASESYNRMIWAKKKGTCIHLKKEGVCKIKPILWWTEDEVWNFINKNALPVNEVYSKGSVRTGCMPCTAYKAWEERMQRVTPKMYEIVKLRKDNQYVMRLV